MMDTRIVSRFAVVFGLCYLAACGCSNGGGRPTGARAVLITCPMLMSAMIRAHPIPLRTGLIIEQTGRKRGRVRL